MLAEADEVFITSTTRPVLSVVRVDGKPVGDGVPGPITRGLEQRFRDLLEADLSA
jgi:branched-subunit amino acid aminotransferase/4-amino-4-deoxychorismate lyase